MRKLLLAASILAVSAGSAFAQNSQTITQGGTHTTGNFDQTGSTAGTINVTQIGIGAAVAGTLVTEVIQSDAGASYAGASFAFIDQRGENARARISQLDSDGAGSGNNAAIVQRALTGSTVPTGFNINGRIEQSGGNDNESIIVQGATLGVDYGGSGLRARNKQTGFGNYSLILQDSITDASPVSFTRVEQIGDGHSSASLQVGSGHLNMTYQDGTGQFVTSNQSGEGTTSNVTQTNGLLGAGSNSAVVLQSSDNGMSDILQEGTTNIADVLQTGTGLYVSNIIQNGTDNFADVDQTGTAGGTVTINQTGSNLSSTASQ